MELKEELAFEDILQAVQHLPEDKRAILKKELSKKKEQPEEGELTDFQKMLLNGPVMSDEHYKAYKEARKQLRWTTK